MKKLLALIMAAAVAAALAAVVFAADTKTISVTYTFDENKADAGLTEHGTITYADGKAVFGADGWLESDIDLHGAVSLKVTAVVKAPEDNANSAWIFECTSQETHYWPEASYVAMLFMKSDGGSLKAERYIPSSDWSDGEELRNLPVTSDFMTIVGEFKADGSVVVSVDGKEAANVAAPKGMDFSLANSIGDAPVFHIGRANWRDDTPDGEFSEGMILDSISIEAEVPAAPQTGFGTISLAIAAIAAGAYVVRGKR